MTAPTSDLFTEDDVSITHRGFRIRCYDKDFGFRGFLGGYESITCTIRHNAITIGNGQVYLIDRAIAKEDKVTAVDKAGKLPAAPTVKVSNPRTTLSIRVSLMGAPQQLGCHSDPRSSSRSGRLVLRTVFRIFLRRSGG